MRDPLHELGQTHRFEVDPLSHYFVAYIVQSVGLVEGVDVRSSEIVIRDGLVTLFSKI